jgi:hypothetical protein
MKMQAQELRIGNWVKNNFGDELQITRISKVFASGYLLESVSPIPLTEEWLFKFGFKYNYFEDEDGYIISNDHVLSLGECSELSIEDDFSFGIASKTSDETVCFDNDIIESVHRLQNIYHALTGEELKLIEE